MKKAILICMLTASTQALFAQNESSGKEKALQIQPYISLKNSSWFENNLVGSLGIHLGIKPSTKLNINLDLGGFRNITRNFAKPENGVAYSLNFSDAKTTPPISASMAAETPQATFQGAFANIDAGIPFKLKDSSSIQLEPFLGIEGKLWNRSLVFGEGSTQTTFDEKYYFLAPSFGAKLHYAPKPKVKLTLRVAVNHPVVAKVKTDEKNLTAPNTSIDLGKQLSPNIEIGAKIKRLTIKVRYERLNIGAADSLKGLYQPASKANLSGISVGYEF